MQQSNRTQSDRPPTRPRRRVRRRADVSDRCDHARALALVGLELWLCHYGAGPHAVIPHVLRTLGGDGCDEQLMEAISEAARKWTKQRGTYRDSDADLIVDIARRDVRK